MTELHSKTTMIQDMNLNPEQVTIANNDIQDEGQQLANELAALELQDEEEQLVTELAAIELHEQAAQFLQESDELISAELVEAEQLVVVHAEQEAVAEKYYDFKNVVEENNPQAQNQNVREWRNFIDGIICDALDLLPKTRKKTVLELDQERKTERENVKRQRIDLPSRNLRARVLFQNGNHENEVANAELADNISVTSNDHVPSISIFSLR